MSKGGGWKAPRFRREEVGSGNAEECSNYCTIALLSRTSKAILQARLQQHMNCELPDVQGEHEDQG